MYLFKLILCSFFLLISSKVISYEINEIVIEGSEFIDKEAILSLVKDKDELTNDEIINLLSKNLYNGGNFQNIQMRFDNKTLIIILDEYPKINDVEFIDNKRFKTDELKKIFAEINTLSNFNPNIIEEFISEVDLMYKSYGYNQLNIDYKIINIENSNLVNLKFQFKEGKISKINKVFYEGNKDFSRSKLDSIIVSKPKRDILFFLNKNFKNFEVENDLIRLKKYYLKKGYVNIEINYKIEFLENKNKFNIYFYINEGNKFNFDNFNLLFSGSEFNNEVRFNLENILSDYRDNEIGNKEANYDHIAKIKELFTTSLFNSGLKFFEILVTDIKNNKANTLNVEFEIKSLAPSYVKYINIFGNTRTLDHVIRREITFSEGDAINDILIAQSTRNLQKLNIFKSVNIKKRFITDDLIDIDVIIEEKTTGDFNIGLSIGTLQGASLVTGLNQNNVGGTGNSIKFSVNTASKNTNYLLAISHPRILNRKVGLNYGLNYNNKDLSESSSYKLNSFKSNVGLDFDITDKISESISLSYSIDDYSITNSSKASANIISLSGKNNIIKLINVLDYNNLNSFIRPSEGLQLNLRSTLSPITNSKDGFVKNSILYKKYIPYENYTFSIKSKIGYIFSLQDDPIIDSEKFALGGNWLRGFDTYGVGPRNSYSSYVGGNNIAVSKFDISRSLFANSQNPIEAYAFSDIGTVYGNKNNPTLSVESIRSSFGYGFKFYTPIGPIGLSWGFPINDESYDIKRQFLFSIGNLN